MEDHKERTFVYKVHISRHPDDEFVIYHSSEKRLTKGRITRIMEELLHSAESGYKVSKITEVKL